MCKDKTPGNYEYDNPAIAPPNNKNSGYYLACVTKTAGYCRPCPAGLIYNEGCDQCLNKGRHICWTTPPPWRPSGRATLVPGN